MKKKVKFPLKMRNGSLVKELDELQANFDLQTVIEYFGNGQLKLWLENNYNDDVLEKINELTGTEPDFILKLTEALGVEYDNEKVDVLNTVAKSRLRNELGEKFESDKLDEIIDYIAENQNQLEQMIKDGVKKIYLYKNEFYIDDKVKEIYFHGIVKDGISVPQVVIKNYNQRNFIGQKLKFRDIDIVDSSGKKIVADSYLGLMDNLLDIFECMLSGGSGK